MPPHRPNVILVLTDDQGYPPLAAHGHPFLRTPNLDRFHAEAVSLDQCHSGTTCAPTRAGLMTGNYCNSTGVWHTIGGRSLLRKDEWTLADALGQAGYRTGLFGKWHLGDEYPYRPQDRGFQTCVVHGGGGIGQGPDWWGNDYFDDTYIVDGRPRAFEGYCTDVFFREAMSFITANQDAPFLCVISTNAPHSPYNVEPRYQALYDGQTKTENYARFLGMISNIDDNFGALRLRLAELGLEDDTVLMFMSDNGQCGFAAHPEGGAFNAGMRGFKGSMYEGGHRIPWLTRWPRGGIGGGQVVTPLSAYIDVMPTLLELCGIAPPAGRAFHGRSLAALLRGEPADTSWTERVIVTDTQRTPEPIKWRMSCVMKGDWRLVNRDELYDLVTDPGQRANIADQHPGVVAELREAYEAWWEICTRQAGETIPISVGAPTQQIAELRTHDLRNADSDVVWNQDQIRAGQACQGYWEVLVERAGDYEFAFRRWPTEAGHAIRTGIEGDDVAFRRDAIARADWSLYTGGIALPITAARLEITGHPPLTVQVADETAAVLRLSLPAGEVQVRGWFLNEAGLTLAPYYIYVRRLEAA
ncbi:arylsulfatase [Phenylobacterium aquaticum]|uniref:arylsulfatase n=1 Tax=Phenylobacterium aquaticum TaxID=1763816 RepID=UPI0026EAC855|nr:arylsulfatase [Phenylobacterium aquaticum]